MEALKSKESGSHKTLFRVEKYHEDITPYKEERREAEFFKSFKPYEVVEREDNCLLNTGIDKLWDLVTGATDQVYDYANAFIGVGDSSQAATATDTDLQATENSAYASMDTGYPSSTTQKATFQASFGDAEANFQWYEWVVKETNGGECLNRKVESLGTKTTGTWTLQVSITLS